MTSGEPRASPERDIPGLFVVPNTSKSDLHMFYSADKAEEALFLVGYIDSEDGPAAPRSSFLHVRVASLPPLPVSATAEELGRAIVARMDAHPLTGRLDSVAHALLVARQKGMSALLAAELALRAFHVEAACEALLAGARDLVGGAPDRALGAPDLVGGAHEPLMGAHEPLIGARERALAVRSLARQALYVSFARGKSGGTPPSFDATRIDALGAQLPPFPAGKCALHDQAPLEEALVEYDEMYRGYYTAVRTATERILAAGAGLIDAAYKPYADRTMVKAIRERIADKASEPLTAESLERLVAAALIDDREAEEMLARGTFETRGVPSREALLHGRPLRWVLPHLGEVTDARQTLRILADTDTDLLPAICADLRHELEREAERAEARRKAGLNTLAPKVDPTISGSGEARPWLIATLKILLFLLAPVLLAALCGLLAECGKKP